MKQRMEKSTGITTLRGQPAQPLGLAGNPEMDTDCVAVAHAAGVNYFFFYNLSFGAMNAGLKPLLQKDREGVIVATGSESRDPGALSAYFSQVCREFAVDEIDVFYAEYISPADDMGSLLGPGGVFEALHRWKAEGRIRYVGATVHNRSLAVDLIESGRIDVLMHRYNMAHRGAEAQVLPAALTAQIPVVAFTCTRWASLLAGHRDWDGPVPSAADCYRYALHHPAVHIALTAPTTVEHLQANLTALEGAEHDPDRLAQWEAYGERVYGDGTDAFDTHWP